MTIEVIAEAGVNHNGKLYNALCMVDAAKTAGADVVKFQTFNPNRMLRADDPSFSYLKSLVLSTDDFKRIAYYCQDYGIEFMSTPGDVDSLKFLVEVLGVKRIKIGSDDMTFGPLLDAAAQAKLPIILSTGLATLKEVGEAVFYLLAQGVQVLTLLHCVSLYPCPPEKANLRAIDTLQNRFESIPVGYSDHVPGETACLAAAARGAVMLEKHFMLKRDTDVPDQAVSVNEVQLADLIVRARQIARMLGTGVKKPCDDEAKNIIQFRKGADGRRGLWE